jgi:hypothetical protein
MGKTKAGALTGSGLLYDLLDTELATSRNNSGKKNSIPLLLSPYLKLSEILTPLARSALRPASWSGSRYSP